MKAETRNVSDPTKNKENSNEEHVEGSRRDRFVSGFGRCQSIALRVEAGSIEESRDRTLGPQIPRPADELCVTFSTRVVPRSLEPCLRILGACSVLPVPG